ncbi:MAG: flagellar biosynthesis protein FlhA [Pirellulaceae bacterium]
MATATQQMDSNFSFAPRSETTLAFAILIMLTALVIPLPTFLLDMFLAINLSGGILLLLITLNSKRPLDVSVFPSLLLLLTLFRLSLNVASTRLILLNGDAGKIVSTFGDFVVGGNLIVGIVIFAILVTIQFIVITKGATRISEVNARFTLDAMPGKQMAIDAELNMGAIEAQEATRRRQELAREAEFYGAMDGASKYVRGDSIAGLIILVVNILGGVTIGMMQGQNLTEALEMYSVLTIGDGLVSQIPALVIATSAGMLVTKSASDSNLGSEISAQVHRAWPAMFTGAAILVLISFTPGFPKLPFFVLSGGLFFVAQRARQQAMAEAEKPKTPPKPQQEEEAIPPDERNLSAFLKTDRIAIEVGAALIPLVDGKNSKDIASRIASMRQELAAEYGFWVPNAVIRDNLNLPVNQYRIYVHGREVGRGELRPNDLLVVLPENGNLDIKGIDVQDPAYGMPARWISDSSRRRAEMLGLYLVEAPSVLIIHLRECLKTHASELLSREDLQKMLNKLKESAPTIVEEIGPNSVRSSTLHQVLVNLISEQVSITALEPIVEAAVRFGVGNKEPEELTEQVRTAIGHQIVSRFQDEQGNVRVIYLEAALEYAFSQMLTEGVIPLKQKQLEMLIEKLRTEWEVSLAKDQPTALIVGGGLRRAIRKTIYRSLPLLPVISFNEMPGNLQIQATGFIRHQDVISAMETPAEAAKNAADGLGMPSAGQKRTA